MVVLWVSQVMLVVKNLPAGYVSDLGPVPGLGIPSGGGHGNYSSIHDENPMNRGACQTTVHRVSMS